MDHKAVQLINSYTPSQTVVNLVEDTSIVLFCGITGAGKDTVAHALLDLGNFTKIITSTTREPRENNGVLEIHGLDYYFFNTDQAIDNLKSKKYFEVARVHEKIYGVTYEEIQRLHSSGKVAIGDVDYQGAEYFKKYSPSTIVIFLVPPSYEVWVERLHKRYDTEVEFQEAWPTRRNSAIKELTWALSYEDISIVVNNQLVKTIEDIGDIIQGNVSSNDCGRETAEIILDRLKADI